MTVNKDRNRNTKSDIRIYLEEIDLAPLLQKHTISELSTIFGVSKSMISIVSTLQFSQKGYLEEINYGLCGEWMESKERQIVRTLKNESGNNLLK